MRQTARRHRHSATLLAFLFSLQPLALAQDADDSFVTGAAAATWQKWVAAMEALLNRTNPDAAETAFGELLAENPSPLRLALFADRSARRNQGAGGVLLLEQDAAAGSLKDNGKKVAELLAAGREQMQEADDGWYFASVGQFGVASANFQALIKSEPDPVALLELTDKVDDRRKILVMLANHAVMGESVRGVLKLLEQGEQKIKSDPVRIKQHIHNLGGPPRMFEYSVAQLRQSGEYVIPFMIQALRDPQQRAELPAIVRTLPKIDRAALNPLVMALRSEDRTSLLYAIRALGQIPYWQSVPYLLQLRDDKNTPAEVRTAVEAALTDLAAHGVDVEPGLSAAEAFFRLARDYYDNRRELAADPRLDSANVWYWRDGLLQNTEVPTLIFNEIMCMRCCEESLRLNPDLKPPLALWIAANFRREAQLPEGQTDFTRPENYPSAAYFAQSAGAEYNLMALARAVDDSDPAVALGTIEALRKTAGPASVISDDGGRLPLAEALSFPERMVRIRAGLALAAARPAQSFHNDQNLLPVLNEALLLHGGASSALVVDPDENTGNEVVAALRAMGYNVVSDADLFAGLEKVRTQLPGVDLIVMASNIGAPGMAEGLKQLRGEFRFAATPVLLLAKQGEREAVGNLARSDARVAEILPGIDPDTLGRAIAGLRKSAGATAITPETGAALAIEAAQLLGGLADSGSKLFRVEDAETALIDAMGSTDVRLREEAARTLGYIGTSTAQQAIAKIALDEAEAEPMRVTMFRALAEAAKRRGNHLSSETTAELIKIAESDANMTIRTAASETLGALNLPSNPASVIVRNQYAG